MYSDEKIVLVNDLSDVVSSQGYLLFYSKNSVQEFIRQTISQPENWPHVTKNVSALANTPYKLKDPKSRKHKNNEDEGKNNHAHDSSSRTDDTLTGVPPGQTNVGTPGQGPTANTDKFLSGLATSKPKLKQFYTSKKQQVFEEDKIFSLDEPEPMIIPKKSVC
jgi:hypothetical protein